MEAINRVGRLYLVYPFLPLVGKNQGDGIKFECLFGQFGVFNSMNPTIPGDVRDQVQCTSEVHCT